MADIRALSTGASGRAGRTTQVAPPRRRWLTRIALPLGILLTTLLLLGYAARESLWPGRSVRVVRVVIQEGGGAGDAGASSAPASVSVQAPGWVEPDPYPIYVSALTDGVVERVLVLEGQAVEEGQVVAELVADDARLALQKAMAELARQRATLQAATTDWENPVALERAAAVNRAMLEESEAELARLDAQIVQEEARLKELDASYRRVLALLPNAASELEVEQAQYQVEAQQALVEATQKMRPVIEAQVSRFKAEMTAAGIDLELRVELRRAVDEAQAQVQEAEAAVAEAELRLERMLVKSPVSGIVMVRLVSPGAKVMLGMDDPHSSHIVHLYDPNHLQVRVDVPLADAAKVGVGQEARIVVDILPQIEFTGRLTRFVHQADIGKNTVEVKVAIEDPSPLLKPDMLARVKFFASRPDGGAGAGSAAASGVSILAPAKAVVREGSDAFVWVVSPGDSRLRRRDVDVGGEVRSGWVIITSGLQPGDVLVAEPASDLVEGERVNIEETASGALP